jgi:hypothetical protein
MQQGPAVQVWAGGLKVQRTLTFDLQTGSSHIEEEGREGASLSGRQAVQAGSLIQSMQMARLRVWLLLVHLFKQQPRWLAAALTSIGTPPPALQSVQQRLPPLFVHRQGESIVIEPIPTGLMAILASGSSARVDRWIRKSVSAMSMGVWSPAFTAAVV